MKYRFLDSNEKLIILKRITAEGRTFYLALDPNLLMSSSHNVVSSSFSLDFCSRLCSTDANLISVFLS